MFFFYFREARSRFLARVCAASGGEKRAALRTVADGGEWEENGASSRLYPYHSVYGLRELQYLRILPSFGSPLILLRDERRTHARNPTCSSSSSSSDYIYVPPETLRVEKGRAGHWVKSVQ